MQVFFCVFEHYLLIVFLVLSTFFHVCDLVSLYCAVGLIVSLLLIVNIHLPLTRDQIRPVW